MGDFLLALPVTVGVDRKVEYPSVGYPDFQIKPVMCQVYLYSQLSEALRLGRATLNTVELTHVGSLSTPDDLRH